MEALYWAEKLRPLMPERVERWLRARLHGDPDLRGLIDRQILTTASKVLGNRDEALLSLPPARRAAGPVRLGTVRYADQRVPLGLLPSDVLQHIAVFGRSGAGKTNLVYQLLRQLIDRGVSVLFFDWKRNGRALRSLTNRPVHCHPIGRRDHPMRFDLLEPPAGVSPHAYLRFFTDQLADAYTLGDAARSLVFKAGVRLLEATGRTPTASQLREAVADEPDNERSRGWKATALRALDDLLLSGIVAEEASQSGHTINDITRDIHVLELDAVSPSAKRFLIPLLCYGVYQQRLNQPRRERLDLVIVLEEAHQVLFRHTARRDETLMEQLLRQSRELGVAFLIVDQQPALISQAALANTYLTAVFNTKNTADVNACAALCQLDERDKPRLQQLPIGRCVIKLQGRWTRPMLVDVPHVAVDKEASASTTQRPIRQPPQLPAEIARTPSPAPVAPTSGGVSRVRESDGGASAADQQAERSFIRDVLDHPDDAVRVRYRRLGWSAGRGHRLKERLLRDGRLKARLIAVGNTRKLVLAVPPELIDERSAPGSVASIEHRFWQRHYAQHLEHMGYRVRLEAPRPRGGGTVDVLAVRPGAPNEQTGHAGNAPIRNGAIAVEIETGKSDYTGNARRNLACGFEQVWVVATDERAMRRIERGLAKAGLLIPGRVSLILRAPAPECFHGGARLKGTGEQNLNFISKIGRDGLD